ncbi:MAG: peptidoglycan editing factor PgeF [Candidatus Omnitrophota bacterium]
MKPKVVFENNRVIAAFSTKKSGHLGFKNNSTNFLKKNRIKFLEKIQIPYKNLVCAKQTHGANVFCVTGKDKSSGALDYENAINNTDSLITNRRNIPLAVFTADCLSIFLYDPKKSAVGIVHAGWRSTKALIAKKTVFKMKQHFKTKPEDLICYFGPAIKPCCYQVGKDFKRYFPKATKKRNNNFYLDLVKVNKNQLLNSGVKKDKIFDSQVCTSCDNDRFFSYRKEKENAGRIMSVIMLK